MIQVNLEFQDFRASDRQ